MNHNVRIYVSDVYLHFVNTPNIADNKHTLVIYLIMIIQLEFKTIELRISSPLERPINNPEWRKISSSQKMFTLWDDD